MPVFETHRRNLLLLAQIAGLIATGWVIWITAVMPRLDRQPPSVVAAEVVKHALLACAWSVAITLGISLVIAQSSRMDAIRMALRTASTAVWFAPASILLSQLSPAAAAASVVLVVSTTRLLYAQAGPRQPVVFVPTGLFDLPHSPALARELAPGLTASFAIQAGVLALSTGHSLWAAALFCLSAAMLTVLSLISGWVEAERPTSLPRSVLGLLLTFILAAGLTVGVIAGHHYGGPDDAGRAASNDSLTKLYEPPTGNLDISDQGFPGVILWPEIQEQPRKIMAPLPSLERSAIQPLPTEPFSIPFSGQYWLFKPPYARPPERSYRRKGSPLALSFLTADRAPMRMEAHQKLEHAIDLRCCRGIRIAISNIDRYPGTVSLQLILMDGRAVQNLGEARVTSNSSAGYWKKSAAPAFEILNFPIPASSVLHKFNEIEVVFQRDRLRIERSANISIERFVLIPR